MVDMGMGSHINERAVRRGLLLKHVNITLSPTVEDRLYSVTWLSYLSYFHSSILLT